MKSIINILLFLLFLPFSGTSQKLWSLDACITYAVKNNLSTKLNVYDTEIRKENLSQTKRNFLPSFGLNTGYNIGYGRYVDPNTNDIINTKSYSNSYSTGTSIQLFNGFRQWNSIAFHKLLLEINKGKNLELKHKLSFDVMNAFYAILFQEGIVKIAKNRQSLSKLHYKTIASKIKLGLLAKSNLYQIESTISSENLSLLKAKNELANAKLNLLQLMNLPQKTIELQQENSLAALNYSSNLSNTNFVFKKALQFLPAIKNTETNIKVAQKSLAISRSSLYPSLSFGTGISTAYYQTRTDNAGNIIPYSKQLQDNLYKRIYFSMYVPIFHKWSTRSSLKIEKIKIKQAKINFEQKKQVVFKQIQTLIQNKNSLELEEEANLQNIKSKELNFKISEKKHEKELINLYELQQAKNELTQAKIEQLRIHLQLKIQKKTIAFYTGMPVFKID